MCSRLYIGKSIKKSDYPQNTPNVSSNLFYLFVKQKVKIYKGLYKHLIQCR